MTTAWNRALIALSITALMGFAVACGDDDGPAPTPDAGPMVDAFMPPTCDPAGACCAPADLQAVGVTMYDYMTMSLDYGDIASVCGQGCALDADPATCTAACIDMATMTSASAGCRDCFVGSVLCGIQNCVGECIADATAPACLACLCGTNAMSVNCIQNAVDCTGIPSTRCD